MALTSCVLSGKQIICACAKGSSPLHVLCLPRDAVLNPPCSRGSLLVTEDVSFPGFRYQLLHAFSTEQERRNKPESSAAKALLLTSSGAREQESKREKEKEQESKREKKNKNKKARERIARTRERKSKSKREKKQEQEREKEWQNPVPFKENYPPPRTYYSLIGCSPSAQLSSRERQNTWWENCPCMCADYVYHLEHSCQCHLIMANVRAAPHRSPFSFNKSNRPPILMRVEIEVKSPVCR